MPLDLRTPPAGLICHKDKKPCSGERCPLWDEENETCLERAVALHLIDAGSALESAAQLAPLVLGGLGGGTASRPDPNEEAELDSDEGVDES